ncbi:MAG: glycosyltransferase family A protein [Chthoniobacterales bacterium]
MKKSGQSEKVAVIVPLFPRTTTVRRALASLRGQTHQPDLVVLIDDGKSPDAEKLQSEIPGTLVEILQMDGGSLPEALNNAVEFLKDTEIVSILGSDSMYAPNRIARCIAALTNPDRIRRSNMVVTAVELIDSRGQMLPATDARSAHLERLWAPIRSGATIPDCLGAGNFIFTESNIFARREYLLAQPFIKDAPAMCEYHAATLAGIQGWLEVIDEPLLIHHMPVVEREPSTPVLTGIIRAQIELLLALREKLHLSSEARRNLTQFYHASWNNLSGLRADIFMQQLLRMASLVPAEAMEEARDQVSIARDLSPIPLYLRDLLRSGDPLQASSYAAALTATRAELADERRENARLEKIAKASQNSGWVRFGAWLGDRGARNIMEMEAAENESALQTPNETIKSRSEGHPKPVGNKHESSHTAGAEKGPQGQPDSNPKKNNLDAGESGILQAEEERGP